MSLKLASAHLNKKYSGEPLGLDSFIDSVPPLATTNELKAFYANLVRTKIDGRARCLITDADNTVDLIIAALRRNMKQDNSKVIKGRMLALKYNHSSQEEFEQKAEELADALRRSLVLEGSSVDQANETAIEETVALCRKNTSNGLVKSVLESHHFKTPKEVVTALVTQTEKAKNDQAILVYGPSRGRGRNRCNVNFHANTAPREYYNRSYRGHGNRQYSNDGRYSGRPPTNGYRGNSNYRGGRGRGVSYRNGQGQHVRVITQSGNGEAPQQLALGAPSNQ